MIKKRLIIIGWGNVCIITAGAERAHSPRICEVTARQTQCPEESASLIWSQLERRNHDKRQTSVYSNQWRPIKPPMIPNGDHLVKNQSSRVIKLYAYSYDAHAACNQWQVRTGTSEGRAANRSPAWGKWGKFAPIRNQLRRDGKLVGSLMLPSGGSRKSKLRELRCSWGQLKKWWDDKKNDCAELNQGRSVTL